MAMPRWQIGTARASRAGDRKLVSRSSHTNDLNIYTRHLLAWRSTFIGYIARSGSLSCQDNVNVWVWVLAAWSPSGAGL